mmetsp:Transcript_8559/g.17217  ORF Transcript_8559/g.17217 Transcript_8559/m.17217 type:complete len:245 (-) Transcript_8559:103-837(-)
MKVDGALHAPIARVGDVELYQWDVDLLQPRRWLNDALIAFAFEHMTQSLTGPAADGIVLVEPTVAFAAAMLPPEALVEMVSGGPVGKARLARLKSARLVILPVNDNPDSERSGGGHWSCLAFRRLSEGGAQFEYYDSCSNANSEAAAGIARCFGKLLGGGANTPVRTMETPQQENGHDCGLYLVRVAQVLCAEACDAIDGGDQPRAATLPPPALRELTPASVGKVRVQLQGLVEAYATPAASPV